MIKEVVKPAHDIKPGDIFYTSWGWEQTNIDFYQVVSITPKTIAIREVKGHEETYDGQKMTGTIKAVADCFVSDKILKKTPYFMYNEWHVDFKNGSGAKWNGKPMRFSCYA